MAQLALATGSNEVALECEELMTSRTNPHPEIDARLRFEMLLTELSTRFVSVTSASIDKEIVDAQRRIVQTLELDRSTLVQLHDNERFVLTHSWQLPGLSPFPGFAVKELPWMASAILRGETVCFARVDDLPPEASR